jgi:hypothetical protein
MAEKSPMEHLQDVFKGLPDRRTGEALKELMETIEETRQRYKALVDDHFGKKDPFPQHREDCEANFVADIDRYLELVGHCIVAGDPEILYKWGINFLDEKDGLSKLSSSDLEDYQETFEERRRDSTSAREKIYMDILIDKFKVLAKRPKSVR